MTRLGYQIPNFTYPNTPEAGIFDSVIAQAKAAEAAGFDRVFVMDHFYQLPGLGPPKSRCSSAIRSCPHSLNTPRQSDFLHW